jgi:molybdopterin-binding protein
MGTLTAEEAAGLLHLHPRQVRRLARAGKLPAARIGRRWLFQRADLERLLRPVGAPAVAAPPGPTPGAGPAGPWSLSARNRLRGTIARLVLDGLMAEIVVRIGDQELVSVITRRSAERLGLQVGDEVAAVIKSTEVMIGKGGDG